MNAYQSQSLRRKIRGWYHRHAPRLPWRETANPYHIFISEVMLQQTQISRVLIKYPEFIKTFPTIQSLARAPLSCILSAWHGMGYNRRGLYLQQSAQIILREHKGNIPKDISALDMLPGIGSYSAGAIACFAYGICEPFIETNIRRVIIHEFFPRKKKVPDAEILQTLRDTQPLRKQREWYWALMDYGREGLKNVPNANRRSIHYVKQSKFEGSPRYVRAKIISYLLENKKATAEELHASLKENAHLSHLSESTMKNALTALEKEKLVTKSGVFFLIV